MRGDLFEKGRPLMAEWLGTATCLPLPSGRLGPMMRPPLLWPTLRTSSRTSPEVQEVPISRNRCPFLRDGNLG
jgi:hypothetical protein